MYTASWILSADGQQRVETQPCRAAGMLHARTCHRQHRQEVPCMPIDPVLLITLRLHLHAVLWPSVCFDPVLECEDPQTDITNSTRQINLTGEIRGKQQLQAMRCSVASDTSSAQPGVWTLTSMVQMACTRDQALEIA